MLSEINMMNMKIRIFFLLFAVVVIGCTQQSDTSDMNAKVAQSIMEDVSERNRERRLLTEKDDTLMERVVAYYKEHGTANELMEAYYLHGSVFRDLCEAPKAMVSFQEGVNVADTLNESCRYDILTRIHAQISELLVKQCSYSLAIQEESRVAKYALLARDTSYYFNSLWTQLGMHYQIKDYECVADECWNLLEESAALNRYREAAGLLIPSVLANLKLGEIKKAETLINIYEEYSGDVDLSKCTSSFPVYYYAKGSIYLSQNQLDSAVVYFNKELSCQDWNNRLMACRGLHEVYRRKGNWPMAYKYARLQCEAVDSDYQAMVTANIQDLHELYDYSRAQKDSYEKKLQLEEKHRNLRRVRMGMGFASIVAFFAFFYIYAQYKKRIVVAELELERANACLIMKEHALELLNEQLQHAIGDVEITRLTDTLKEVEQETKHQEMVVETKREELSRLRKWTQMQAKEIRMRYQGEKLFLDLLEKAKNSKVAVPEDYELVEKRLLQDDVRLIRRFYKTVPDASETDRKTFLLMRYGMSKSETSALMAHEKSTSSKTCDRMFERTLGRAPSNRAEAYKWLLEV